MSHNRLVTAAAIILSLAAAPVSAAPNLIVNGDFETTTMTGSNQIGYATTTTTGSSTTTNPNTITGWSNPGNGYNFLFFANTSTANGQYGAVSLYTAANGGTGGNANLNSPTGGNFIANDGGFQTGAITQTLNGLTVGTNYLLSFYWAAGQQTGYTGATTEAWNVSFGNSTQSTGTVTTPSQGFTPWRQATMLFGATATTQTLAFLATGTPNGQPPFALLDGVSLVAAPEPASWALVLVGLGGATFLARRRRT
ncbi:MAG: PEP-CTERM sorting domain-containing protein [Janthinobacterium lividum]